MTAYDNEPNKGLAVKVDNPHDSTRYASPEKLIVAAARCEVSISDTGLATTVAAAGTNQPVVEDPSAEMTVVLENDCTFDATAGTITVNKGGFYRVRHVGDVLGENSAVGTVELELNDTAVAALTQAFTMAGAAVKIGFSRETVLELSPGDVLELNVDSDNNADDVTLSDYHLCVEQLTDAVFS